MNHSDRAVAQEGAYGIAEGVAPEFADGVPSKFRSGGCASCAPVASQA